MGECWRMFLEVLGPIGLGFRWVRARFTNLNPGLSGHPFDPGYRVSMKAGAVSHFSTPMTLTERRQLQGPKPCYEDPRQLSIKRSPSHMRQPDACSGPLCKGSEGTTRSFPIAMTLDTYTHLFDQSRDEAAEAIADQFRQALRTQ
jgi:hypothetical protein